MLGSNVVTRPFAAIGQIRSRGITNLRYGHVLESSWHANGIELDRFERKPDGREPLPLPEGVACFTVAASTANQPGAVQGQLIGDGLVPVRSALGQHDEPRHCLAFAAENKWTAYGTNHMDLLKRPDVTVRVADWLRRLQPCTVGRA